MIGQRDSDVSKAKKELAKAEKRQKLIDAAFAKLYEDRLTGNITERNYVMLSENYQKEQETLDVRISELKSTINETTQIEANVERFADIIEKYDNITELTAPMLNALIDKIVVYESTKNKDGTEDQQIDIYYRLIGKIE